MNGNGLKLPVTGSLETRDASLLLKSLEFSLFCLTAPLHVAPPAVTQSFVCLDLNDSLHMYPQRVLCQRVVSDEPALPCVHRVSPSRDNCAHWTRSHKRARRRAARLGLSTPAEKPPPSVNTHARETGRRRTHRSPPGIFQRKNRRWVKVWKCIYCPCLAGPALE